MKLQTRSTLTILSIVTVLSIALGGLLATQRPAVPTSAAAQALTIDQPTTNISRPSAGGDAPNRSASLDVVRYSDEDSMLGLNYEVYRVSSGGGCTTADYITLVPESLCQNPPTQPQFKGRALVSRRSGAVYFYRLFKFAPIPDEVKWQDRYRPQNEPPLYPDVPHEAGNANHWQEIETASAYGLFSGRACASNPNLACFYPDNNLRRDEMSKNTVEAPNLAPAIIAGAPHFSDVPLTHIFFDYIETAFTYRLVYGSGGLYRPSDAINRAEYAAILSRILDALLGRDQARIICREGSSSGPLVSCTVNVYRFAQNVATPDLLGVYTATDTMLPAPNKFFARLTPQDERGYLAWESTVFEVNPPGGYRYLGQSASGLQAGEPAGRQWYVNRSNPGGSHLLTVWYAAPTPTTTPTSSSTPTNTPDLTGTAAASQTACANGTLCTPTPTATATSTPTNTPDLTGTAAASATACANGTLCSPTPTNTATSTPTSTPDLTGTAVASATACANGTLCSPTPTNTATSTPTNTPDLTGTAVASQTACASGTLCTPTPSNTATSTPTTQPSSTPMASSTSQPSSTPLASSTSQPSGTPTVQPTTTATGPTVLTDTLNLVVTLADNNPVAGVSFDLYADVDNADLLHRLTSGTTDGNGSLRLRLSRPPDPNLRGYLLAPQPYHSYSFTIALLDDPQRMRELAGGQVSINLQGLTTSYSGTIFYRLQASTTTTTIPATTTSTSVPPSATATAVPPSSTSVPPTSTNVPPTASPTIVPPTVTSIAATSPSVSATATRTSATAISGPGSTPTVALTSTNLTTTPTNVPATSTSVTPTATRPPLQVAAEPSTTPFMIVYEPEPKPTTHGQPTNNTFNPSPTPTYIVISASTGNEQTGWQLPTTLLIATLLIFATGKLILRLKLMSE